MNEELNDDLRYRDEVSKEHFISTRHLEAQPSDFDQSQPRLGRRESEPHSHEIMYIRDVLTTNFPDSRTLWDLHHYFKIKFPKPKKIDLKFDLSFFLGWKIDKYLTSFNSASFDNRIPTIAINVLSRNTWQHDIGENRDICELVKIPYYVVYPAYDVASDYYKPPFLRVYSLKENNYISRDIFTLAMESNGTINPAGIVDLGSEIPFRIGLMERKHKIFEDESMFSLLIFDKHKDICLLSEAEREKRRAEQEKQRAEKYKELLKRHNIPFDE